MSEIQHITWLIGSPKAKGSTSEALGGYFTGRFEDATVSRFQAHKVIRREKDTQVFLDDLDIADLFVVSFPLYVDSLPYVLTKTFELIAAQRAGRATTKPQRIVCIANCGLPEAHHNDLALEMCQVFAGQISFKWLGGIAIGGGGVIHGAPLENRGNMTQNYREAFTEAAHQVIADQTIREETLAQFRKSLIPPRLYTGFGTIGWMMQIKQNGGTIRALWDTPYAEK
jgi:hypothetical protein